ncbi:hypothetical protein F3Y22_tig00110328pilonHSYRG00934 [Hibiscus syriacus]|uniref:Fe2OG dioxygenase domain-containing protein n=1 Tax=Hibiscus syriacus TaxID=106335 RepID=A0A6A3AZ22_HIBSY|nr:hypothetical protein F3Y22_tig00110328pilonHSYRG00934 [Hibiscus syriacus]
MPTQFMKPNDDLFGTEGAFDVLPLTWKGSSKETTSPLLRQSSSSIWSSGCPLRRSSVSDRCRAATRASLPPMPTDSRPICLGRKRSASDTEEETNSDSAVVDYFTSTLGQGFEQAGRVYQKYCENMRRLSLIIMELLALSLGVDRSHYRKLFEGGTSIMRGNYYPPCKNSGVTFGTGPHCDPNSITILHQDSDGGLEIFTGNKWVAVPPRQDAFAIIMGDTFMVYFVSPDEDAVVKPPEELVVGSGRLYPDFSWSYLLDFANNRRRVDLQTLENFFPWFLTCQPN